jgi:type III restriction enzyme
LLTSRGLVEISSLILERHRFRDAIAEKIDAHRRAEHKAAFQALLLPAAGLAVNEERSVDFSKIIYDPSWWYEGGFEFKKHYFGKVGELQEKRADNKVREEFQCAQFLDGLPEVKYWVRNLSRRPSSFRLQTSTDYFYPDFICLLHDGRALVVEYKGEDRWDGIDSEEKRAVGAVWEGRSDGKCLFVMPEGKDFESIRRKLMHRTKVDVRSNENA